MSIHFSEPKDLPKAGHPNAIARYMLWAIAGAALTYAFLAGFHTLQDFDLGWQLATGRWVVQHHRVFSVDVFSYTAVDRPWMYPALSGVVFYLSFLAGGYGLLSWLGAIACAGTVALLLRNGSIPTAVLALMAVPLIANRTQPRAEMFTTILFAAFLGLLWSHFRGARSTLWLLPLLMILWVNLHPGFAAGLLLCVAYIGTELLEFVSAHGRGAALHRLRGAWPWLAFTCAATFVNPWGPYIYGTLARQVRAQGLHNLWVVEWEGVHLSWSSLQQALDWRDPQSSFWWLAALAIAGSCIALWRKHWSAALLLCGSLFFAFWHLRLHSLFGCVVVLVGGSIFHEYAQTISSSRLSGGRVRQRALIVLVIALAALAGVRDVDLVSNRYYLRSNELALFGPGISSWFPERAVDFLQREKLPANLFNGYALGGYLSWRLFPAYRDYIDSRALPFGSDLFFRAYDLAAEAPESTAWKQEVDARGINTIIAPLSRYEGMTLFPHLHEFCHSKSWAPVYMDDVSAIFVRRSPETISLIARLEIDCDKKSLELPPDPERGHSGRSQAQLFNAWANAGGILYSLERYPEALAYLDHAEEVFQQNANLHLLRALVFEQLGRSADAESEFGESLELEPNEETAFDLGLFYMTQKRYADAAEVFQQSAESSSRPHEMWMMLGQALLQTHEPEPALAAFDKAEAASPFGGAGEAFGAGFNSMIATGRAKACYQMGQLAQAVSFQEDAVRLAPNDAKLWLGLADLYDAQGRTAEAEKARTRAKQL